MTVPASSIKHTILETEEFLKGLQGCSDLYRTAFFNAVWDYCTDPEKNKLPEDIQQELSSIFTESKEQDILQLEERLSLMIEVLQDAYDRASEQEQ